jgi:hypothetical protein
MCIYMYIYIYDIRCVVDWFGTWSQSALAQVGFEFTMQLDTGMYIYI